MEFRVGGLEKNPRWGPKYKGSHTMHARAVRKMILVSKGMFSGSMNSIVGYKLICGVKVLKAPRLLPRCLP